MSLAFLFLEEFYQSLNLGQGEPVFPGRHSPAPVSDGLPDIAITAVPLAEVSRLQRRSDDAFPLGPVAGGAILEKKGGGVNSWGWIGGSPTADQNHPRYCQQSEKP